MIEPFTLAAIGSVALTEGIKFLYGQAGDVLKRWHDRRAPGASPLPESSPAEEPPTLPSAFEGQLRPFEMDYAAVARLEQDLRRLRLSLADYADGIDDVDPADRVLLDTVDALRRGLEAVFQQRLTFRGEARPPSGPVIDARIDVDEVAGYLAGVRADRVETGVIKVAIEVDKVTGQAVGIDAKRIGGSTADQRSD